MTGFIAPDAAMIAIQPFRSDHLPSLVELLDQTFTIRNPDKAGLVRWKFFDPIHKDGTVMSVALDGGRVVAQYANTPIALADGGRPLPAMVCGDMATAPTHRGRGLISQLARDVYGRVSESGVMLSIGFSNEAGVQVDRNAKGYGYRVVGRFARYVAPAMAGGQTAYRLEPAAGFDGACLPVCGGLRLHKSAEYLTWRYVRKPNADYRIFRVVREDETRGYAVLRAAQARLHLVDLTVEPDAGVLRAVRKVAAASGAYAVVAYVLDNASWRSALRGFVRLPALRRLENYYLTVKPHGQSLPDGWESPARWRLMGGDII